MKKQITIQSIYDGIQPSFHFGRQGQQFPGQYLASIAIDPDAPVSDAAGDYKNGGAIRPISFVDGRDSDLDQIPNWIEMNPANSLAYIYGSGGDFYSKTLGSANVSLLQALSSSSGNGMKYYDDYFYLATNNDIDRYGPISGSPAYTANYWTSTLGLTALLNVQNSSRRHGNYPNHPMHLHVDNKLYIADNASTGAAVKSQIHVLKTLVGADAGSAYGVLKLPTGFHTYDIESLGLSIAIGASYTTTGTSNQGDSALFVWDTTSSNFDTFIRIPDPLLTALKYVNGILYGWSGSVNGGTRFWQYVGGNSIQTIAFIEDSLPPSAGAVDADGHRMYWGGFNIYPEAAASVYAFGSKADLFPRGLHNVARSTIAATATTGEVTALVKAVQIGKSFPPILIGAANGTTFSLDERGTTYQTSVWRSRVFNISKRFQIERVNIRLGQTMAANMTIIPKLVFDNESVSQTGTTINNTNYPSAKKLTLGPSDFSSNVEGQNNFFLELRFTGTALAAVILPIVIDIDIYDNPDD